MRNVVRLTGKDRIMQLSVLLPKLASVTISEALHAHLPPVLVTETFTDTEDGREIGVRRGSVPLQQFLAAVRNPVLTK